MTLEEFNELRWRTIAKKYHIPLVKARMNYPAEKDLPEWARDANPVEISRGWGRRYAMKKRI